MDILVFSIAAVFVIKYRKQIVNTINKNPKPGYKTILLSTLPFIIFEELINAPLPVLIISVPGLLISVFILIFFAKLFHIKKILPILLGYSIIGIFFEINLGGASEEFAKLEGFTYAFITFWVGWSYTFIATIPLTLYLRNNKLSYEK